MDSTPRRAARFRQFEIKSLARDNSEIEFKALDKSYLNNALSAGNGSQPRLQVMMAGWVALSFKLLHSSAKRSADSLRLGTKPIFLSVSQIVGLLSFHFPSAQYHSLSCVPTTGRPWTAAAAASAARRSSLEDWLVATIPDRAR